MVPETRLILKTIGENFRLFWLLGQILWEANLAAPRSPCLKLAELWAALKHFWWKFSGQFCILAKYRKSQEILPWKNGTNCSKTVCLGVRFTPTHPILSATAPIEPPQSCRRHMLAFKCLNDRFSVTFSPKQHSTVLSTAMTEAMHAHDSSLFQADVPHVCSHELQQQKTQALLWYGQLLGYRERLQTQNWLAWKVWPTDSNIVLYITLWLLSFGVKASSQPSFWLCWMLLTFPLGQVMSCPGMLGTMCSWVPSVPSHAWVWDILIGFPIPYQDLCASVYQAWWYSGRFWYLWYVLVGLVVPHNVCKQGTGRERWKHPAPSIPTLPTSPTRPLAQASVCSRCGTSCPPGGHTFPIPMWLPPTYTSGLPGIGLNGSILHPYPSNPISPT